MSGRYKAIPEKTKNRPLVYVVIDTLTGEWKHVYDCFLWAEHKAEAMNKEWIYDGNGRPKACPLVEVKDDSD